MTWVREPDLRALVKKYIGEYEASYIPFGFEPISSWARLKPSDWEMIETLRRELKLRMEMEKKGAKLKRQEGRRGVYVLVQANDVV
jgi:hypothetical protein